jgi:leader peptidase (prepilin peptidase) / N-methyltransferase
VELVLTPLLAASGFALGWPLERLVQQFPRGTGSPPSARRRLVLAVMTALAFALVAWRTGFEPRLGAALLLTALVVPSSAIDLEHRILPNLINLPGAAAVFALALAAQPERWLELLLGGLVTTLFLGSAWLVSPRGMGLGDVKLGLMIGLALGKLVSVALVVAFAGSAVLSLTMLVRYGKGARKASFPFGPFLAAGAVAALAFGQPLLDWYLR